MFFEVTLKNHSWLLGGPKQDSREEYIITTKIIMYQSYKLHVYLMHGLKTTTQIFQFTRVTSKISIGQQRIS